MEDAKSFECSAKGADEVIVLTEEADEVIDLSGEDDDATVMLEEKTLVGTIIDKLCEFIATNTDERIVLLRNREVIMWLFGDLSFLPPIEKKNKTRDEAKYKVLEDRWGQSMLKTRRPDLKLDKQWTNKFGEHIGEEIILLSGKEFNKPEKKEHMQPDSEDPDNMWEFKGQTFFTTGTAGEKIMAVPLKYDKIPSLYSKPLKILCIGGAEKVCREQYGILPGEKCSLSKQEILDFYKSKGFEYIGATDILKSFISL